MKISLEASEDAETECYSMAWTPVNCHVELKVGVRSRFSQSTEENLAPHSIALIKRFQLHFARIEFVLSATDFMCKCS